MVHSMAAICVKQCEPLILDEITVDDPREGEVLVKLNAAGICSTDLLAFKGLSDIASFPTVLGHECVGIAWKIGKGVTEIKEGDAVIPLYIPECGVCPQCLSSETNLCMALSDKQRVGLMSDGTTRMNWRHGSVYHFMGISAFSEYIVVPQIALAKIRLDIPSASACLLGCAMTTGVGAPLWALPVNSGSSVAVFGCGVIGLNIIQGCRLAGASTIIAIDINDSRLAKSVEFGATHTLNAGANALSIVQKVRRLTGGGADFTFEATGKTSVMKQTFEACKYAGGKCCLIGIAAPGDEVCISPQMLIAGRTLKGAAYGGAKGRRHVPILADWHHEGKISSNGLIEREISLTQINDALDEMQSSTAYRTVITY